jgi:DNA polymerase III delta prime subunit
MTSPLDDLTTPTVHLLAQGQVERIYGPPGTGKSTTLKQMIRDVVAQDGTESVLVTSFTVTAAKSLAGMDLPIPDRQVGTLHSAAYRAIGTPDVALDTKVLKDWNSRVRAEWRITSDGRRGSPDNVGDMGPGGDGGDELIAAYDMARSQLIPVADMPAAVREFAQHWESWKRDVDAVDFCMDEQTEVFTARGWLRGDAVRDGDLVRSIDPDTGMAGWQPVESVYRRRGRSPMIHMVNAVHDSMTTPDHRWLVDRRDSHENWSRNWVTTARLNSTARIIRAAVSADASTEAKYSDPFVELVAWWFTEGSHCSGYRGGQISQSHRVNPLYTARIGACLRALCGPPGLRRDGLVRWSISRSEKRGMTFYVLGGDLIEDLDAAAPDKAPSIEFLAQLTGAQLRMFVATALDADGHRRRQAWTFEQSDRRRTESFAAAATLAGMSVTFAAPRRMGDGWAYGTTVSDRRLHAVVPGTTTGHSKGTRTLVDYDGLIWCPTVAQHHNFLARRNGKTYYTGNTDMIQIALARAMDGERAPGNPKVIISDEAQDMTPLETALVLAWGAHADRTVLALDDDQAIMGWRGGNADPILSLGTGLDGGPQLGVDIVDRVLDQSWRIPASLHTVAQTWIELCSHRRDKPYRPRDVDGQTYSVSHPIESMRTAEAIARDAHAGRSVMVIAACEYMLRVLIANLRTLGVPFANRYRPLEGRWNPLRAANGMTTAERLFRYLILDERALGDRSRLWTGDDVRAWIELIRTDAGLARGAKTAVKMLPAGELSIAQVEALFASEDALVRATEPELGWLLESVANKYADKVGYPAQVARAHGAAALMDPAPVTVGTIHCSPADEPVLTTEGYVPIGELDPNRHRLASYHQGTNTLFWNMTTRSKKQGYPFAVARNPYSGALLSIKTAASATRVTPDHRVRVGFTEDYWEKWVVYLMRRGDWWRVGIAVSGHRPYRSGGVAGRLATEQADGGWVLHVCETRREALMLEAQVQMKYGIPGMTFESTCAGRSLTSADIHEIYDSTAGAVGLRARVLLEAYGYSETCPLYSRENVKHNRPRGWFTTEARNILSGYMAIPTVGEDFASGGKPEVTGCVVTSEYFEGDVYSLEVLPHHYYVSGGAVVHNSVKGGQADVVYLCPSVSGAGWGEWVRGGRARDHTVRQFYVGLTRAKETCVVLGSTERHIPDGVLCPREMEVR